MRRFRALWEASWSRHPGDAFPWYTSDLPDATRELLESNVVPKGRAVDIGCGDGVLAVMISARGWATVGVDFAVAALQRATTHDDGLDPPSFAAGAAPNLPFRADAFAFAFDRGCMHNLPLGAWPAYLQDVGRILAPGGVFDLWFTGSVVAKRWSDRVLRQLEQSLGKIKPRQLTTERLTQDLPPELETVSSERIPFVMRSGRRIVFDRFVLRKRAA